MTEPFFASTAEQLEVIASPGREAIIDAVALIGPCSIPQLGKALHRSHNSLYYHVKALRDCGLLVETHKAGEGMRTAAYYDVPGRPFWVSFDLGSQARQDAVQSLARTRMRTAMREFEKACCSGAVTVEGARRDLWATHLKGWLSPEELEEANVLLRRLVELVGSGAREDVSGKKAYDLTFILSPKAM